MEVGLFRDAIANKRTLKTFHREKYLVSSLKIYSENIMKQHKIFSFFSGSGLLDLAFEQNGYEISFVNEYFEPFAGAYTYSRERLGLKLPEYGVNVCSIDEYLEEKNNTIKKHLHSARENALSIGFIGGPPCPDFSIGGKNKGAVGENGKLSRSYFLLILDNKPDWFIFENVKGL